MKNPVGRTHQASHPLCLWSPIDGSCSSSPFSLLHMTEHKVFTLIGLLGNPSDIYNGRTISLSLGTFGLPSDCVPPTSSSSRLTLSAISSALILSVILCELS